LSRIDAHSDFVKGALQLSRYQNIGQTFGLYVAASGQVAADPVSVSEEYAVGGAQFGRAYDYAQISGDHGVSGSVEFRYGRYAKSSILKFYQLYGFYDAGWVWNMNVTSRFREASVTSAGMGVRLTLQNSLYLTYEAAWPLSQTQFAHTDTGMRNFVSLSANF
jgi:hemolysin activation/secretion protein